MKKNIYAWIAASLSVCALCASAQQKSDGDKDFSYTQDFENSAAGKPFGERFFEAYKMRLVSGEEAISGKVSLEVDGMELSGEYPHIFKLGDFKGGKIYRVTFKYKVLANAEGNKYGCFALLEGDIDGRTRRLGSRNFGRNAGETGEVDVFAHAGLNVSEMTITIDAHRGAKLVLDEFSVIGYDARGGDWMFDKKAFIGMRVNIGNPDFAIQHPYIYKMTKEEFFPFIDRYGQFKHADWPGKIKSDADFKERLAEEKKFMAANPPIADRDEFGGFINPARKYKATGRFRLQKEEGKWFFVTPRGNLFWSFGIDCSASYPTTPITGREFYFEDVSNKDFTTDGVWGSRDYRRIHSVYSFTKQNVELKYGAGMADKYAQIAIPRMIAWGVNTCGAWSHDSLLKAEKVPFAAFVNSGRVAMLKPKMTMERKDIPDFFDTKFEANTMESVAKKADFIRSAYCMGVFVDNELPWQTKEALLAKGVLSCPAAQFAKLAFRDQLKGKYKTIAALNKAWNSEYSKWDEFLEVDAFFPKTGEGEADMLAFERRYNEKYFSVCRKAVKAVSPEALYLGCRFAWTNDLVQRAASEYCDAVSHNLYRKNVAGYRLPEGCADKPIIVGEFHFGNQDRGIFGGALRPCMTYADKLSALDQYMLSAIENPVIVGAHWFQWFDQCTTGRSDGENYAVGFVDIADTPYYEMAEISRRHSQSMYEHRLNCKSESLGVNTEATTTY